MAQEGSNPAPNESGAPAKRMWVGLLLLSILSALSTLPLMIRDGGLQKREQALITLRGHPFGRTLKSRLDPALGLNDQTALEYSLDGGYLFQSVQVTLTACPKDKAQAQGCRAYRFEVAGQEITPLDQATKDLITSLKAL